MKKTLFFDFDGVIADSLPLAFEVNRMTRPTLTFEGYKSKFKNNEWLRANNKDAWSEPENGVIVDFQEEFAKKMGALSLNPQKKAVLQRLSKNYNFHIISGTNTETIRVFLRRNGIEELFGEILGYDVETSKVKKFRMLFDTYHLHPQDLIFVTDTAGDIEEAKEVGIRTIIAVTDGFQDRETLEAAKPTHVIDSMLELENII